jgi:hypothetical protein
MAQGANEVLVEAAPTGMTLQCGGSRLALVRAALPSDPNMNTGLYINALGYALVPPKAGADVKFFGRYWFRMDGREGQNGPLLEKRDDDSGTLKSSLATFDASELTTKLSTFFDGCVLTPEQQAAFRKVLTEATSNLSLSDVRRDFENSGVQLNLGTVRQARRDLGQLPAIDSETQMKFTRGVRDSFGELFNAVQLPGGGDGRGDGEESTAAQAELKKLAAERDAAQKERDAAVRQRDEALAASRLSSYLKYLFWLLATAVALLGAAAAALVARPSWRESVRRRLSGALRTPAPPPTLGPPDNGERSDAERRLDEILNKYPVRYAENKGGKRGAQQLYDDFRTEIMGFRGSGLGQTQASAALAEPSEVAAVKDLVVYCLGREYASRPLADGVGDLKQKFDANLDPLTRKDSNLLGRLMQARRSSEKIWEKLGDGPCPEDALGKIVERLAEHEKVVEPLKRVCAQQEPKHHWQYVQEAVNIFTDLNHRFKANPTEPGQLRSKVGGFFNDLGNTYMEAAPGSSAFNATPGSMLTTISVKLSEGKAAERELKTLTSRLDGLKRELGPENGQADPVERAKEVARAHGEALNLLAPYAQANNGDLKAATTTVVNQISLAREAIGGVVENASGTIDVMVASLIAQYNANKHLADQTREIQQRADVLQGELVWTQERAGSLSAVASSLSRLLYLSEGGELDGERAAAISGRLEKAEFVHYQLRLRLSAALSSLDRATQELTEGGREDALTALRVEQFRPELLSLLDDMENFRGDELWNTRLYKRFASQGLSLLLRAESLGITYFADDPLLSRLIDPLHQAGEALRAAMRSCGVEVTPVNLLSAPPHGARVDDRVDPALGALPEVRSKVLNSLSQPETFIVDVESFPYRAGESASGGVVIRAIPAEWWGKG